MTTTVYYVDKPDFDGGMPTTVGPFATRREAERLTDPAAAGTAWAPRLRPVTVYTTADEWLAQNPHHARAFGPAVHAADPDYDTFLALRDKFEPRR
jgi:hypothetical protein